MKNKVLDQVGLKASLLTYEPALSLSYPSPSALSLFRFRCPLSLRPSPRIPLSQFRWGYGRGVRRPGWSASYANRVYKGIHAGWTGSAHENLLTLRISCMLHAARLTFGTMPAPSPCSSYFYAFHPYADLSTKAVRGRWKTAGSRARRQCESAFFCSDILGLNWLFG